jgi:hypothetical protein
VRREAWDRTYSRLPSEPPPIDPSSFTGWVRRHENGIPEHIVDIGCGRGVDDLWFARQGATVTGFDYVLRGSLPVSRMAADEGVDLELRSMNLCELRSVLSESGRVAAEPGRTVVTARNIADATDRVGRGYLWRACEMMLRGGGRLYLEFLLDRGHEDPFARRNHLHRLPMRGVVDEIEARGGTVVRRGTRRELSPGTSTGHRIGRLVVEWQR